MSERNFHDQDSLEEYRADLIRQRSKLNPITNQLHIKAIDEILKNLPERYPEQVYVDNSYEEPRATFKEKISNSLGTFGCIIYYLFSLFIAALPFIFIDLSFILTFILILVEQFLPITSIIFWIWGLICAILGEQDTYAIIYYIAFVVLWIPFFISTIRSLLRK